MLRCSAVAGVDAVGLTVAALLAQVGAKLQRVVGWIYLHERKRHRPRAQGATGGRHSRKPLFCSHVIPHSAETVVTFDQALSRLSRSHHNVMRHGLRRLSAVILVIMQEARDLARPGSLWREIGKRSRVFEEFPLDFGRETTP
jgi:hypothetical protein